MLPSDHFVRMYNELFKMLEERGHRELRKYWTEIARLQDTILGPYIRKNGLKGMYEYWDHIRHEENCDADLEVTEEYFEFTMNRCPSLSKNLDNDAGQFEYYCDHCAGWIEPVVRKYGYFLVYDMISRHEPRCRIRIYKDQRKAEEFAAQVRLPADPYGGNTTEI
ncbi:MAG: hypothetical protein ACLFST_12945 [Spirochaetia bacterium]